MKNLTLFNPALKYFSVAALYPSANQALAQYGAKEKGLGDFAIQYSDELIVAACLFLLVLSSIIGVFYKTPVYGGKPLPLALKAPVCVAFGFCAFLYCLHEDKSLTLLTPIWVGGMSFIGPAVIHLIHAFLVKHFSLKLGVDEQLLKKLEAENSVES